MATKADSGLALPIFPALKGRLRVGALLVPMPQLWR